MSRLIFPIGVAYGSDTKLVEDTLLQVAHACPLVLNDPEPDVIFQEFGDSTLNFELRIVIPTRERFLEARHDLNMRIDRAFREHNIEIAFPQQDVHLKGLEGMNLQPPPDDRPDKPGKEPADQRTAKVVNFQKKSDPEDLTGTAFAELRRDELPTVIFPRRAA